jgi:hypothetical protein
MDQIELDIIERGVGIYSYVLDISNDYKKGYIQTWTTTRAPCRLLDGLSGGFYLNPYDRSDPRLLAYVKIYKNNKDLLADRKDDLAQLHSLEIREIFDAPENIIFNINNDDIGIVYYNNYGDDMDDMDDMVEKHTYAPESISDRGTRMQTQLNNLIRELSNPYLTEQEYRYLKEEKSNEVTYNNYDKYNKDPNISLKEILAEKKFEYLLQYLFTFDLRHPHFNTKYLLDMVYHVNEMRLDRP